MNHHSLLFALASHNLVLLSIFLAFINQSLDLMFTDALVNRCDGEFLMWRVAIGPPNTCEKGFLEASYLARGI